MPEGAPWVEHGGRLQAARRAYPGAPEPWIDLSTGISPWAYPLPELLPEDWARLPDPSALADLERLAGRAFGVPPGAATVAAAGSESLLRLLPTLRPHARVAIVGPTYGGHADAWAGHHEVAVVEGLDEAAGADVVVLVNPNNPDGRTIEAARLAETVAGLAARGGWLVVDEAFADLGHGGIPPALREWTRGLVVLRSFGKTYGLAGVRLGFAVVHRELAAGLRARLGDWPVSGPAIRIAAHAYADAGWRTMTAGRAGEAARRLDEFVERAGGRTVGGSALFRLTEWPDAQAVFDRLAHAAILTRPFADAPNRLRFGLPGDEREWARLAAALTGDE